MDKPVANLFPAIYAHQLHDVQVAARQCGYTIAVHGSMQRDFDLIAVPWTDDAVEPRELVEHLCGTLGRSHTGAPRVHLHGREVHTILMHGEMFLDISIFRPAGSKQ